AHSARNYSFRFLRRGVGGGFCVWGGRGKGGRAEAAVVFLQPPPAPRHRRGRFLARGGGGGPPPATPPWRHCVCRSSSAGAWLPHPAPCWNERRRARLCCERRRRLSRQEDRAWRA